MSAMTIQLRQRGALTLPAKLRTRYSLGAGDVLTVVDLEGAIVLIPKVSVVPKLAAEIESLRRKAGVSLEDLLEGLDEQRRKYHAEKYGTARDPAHSD